MKTIYLLGATGSIGLQTIEIIKANKSDFNLKAISGYNNFDLLKNLIFEFDLDIVCVKDITQANILKDLYPDLSVVYGEEGLTFLAEYNPEQEITLVNALVGMVGLKPTLKAIEINRDVLLANKETLVVGGHLIKEKLKHSTAHIYPIDSEHSALWQAINGEDIKTVKRLIITASGGAFRDKTREELKNVSLQSALNHPNWQMGKKITIDSATMINKGFEIIEASYLFDIDIDKVEAILHKESIIHSMVEFNDGSIIAQIADHDMRLPISYAMYYPLRKPSIANTLDLTRLNDLHFSQIDINRYPCLEYAKEAFRKGGSLRTVLNAANEVAVRLFLEEKISFLEIERIIRKEMDNHEIISFPSLEEIYSIDKEIKQRIYHLY
ncbi:MAG: 1-deoxy-D-xylulose-5-phosphate reductoisomerase [Candidatus Izemoplasmatales bacterium]